MSRRSTPLRMHCSMPWHLRWLPECHDRESRIAALRAWTLGSPSDGRASSGTSIDTARPVLRARRVCRGRGPIGSGQPTQANRGQSARNSRQACGEHCTQATAGIAGTGHTASATAFTGIRIPAGIGTAPTRPASVRVRGRDAADGMRRAHDTGGGHGPPTCPLGYGRAVGYGDNFAVARRHPNSPDRQRYHPAEQNASPCHDDVHHPRT